MNRRLIIGGILLALLWVGSQRRQTNPQPRPDGPQPGPTIEVVDIETAAQVTPKVFANMLADNYDRIADDIEEKRLTDIQKFVDDVASMVSQTSANAGGALTEQIKARFPGTQFTDPVKDADAVRSIARGLRRAVN